MKRLIPSVVLFLAGSALLLTSVATGAAPDLVKVSRWEPHDLTFRCEAEVANRFLVRFSAEATGPDDTKMTLPGFYDGDQTWKIRFTPTMEGEWTLVTRSDQPELDSQRIGLVCTANTSNTAHGALRVDPQYPRNFSYEDGTRFFPLGYECDWLWALDMDDPQLSTINPFLDKLAAHGFNYVILNAYAHDTDWRPGKTGPDDFGPPPAFAWEGSNDTPDHSRFNLDYWQHYDRVIDALHQRGMIAHVMIKVYNKKVNWPAKGSPEEDLYFRWLIARLAAYPNVHWDFSKESNNEPDLDYKLERLRFIRDNDPYKRLITVHDDHQTYDRGVYNDVLDYRSDQQHSDWRKTLLEHRSQKEWPIINVEFGYEYGPEGPQDITYQGGSTPLDELCRRAWQICTAGGFVAYYYTYTAWDVIRPDDTPPGYGVFHHLREFFEDIPYWRMEPSDSLVSEGYCLADPGNDYVVFLDTAAPVSIKLEQLDAAEMVWLNPLTGQREAAGEVEGGAASLTPPEAWGDGPVALWVTAADAARE